ncbi:MAG: ABC transporter permease [Clostridiales bacterium]|nr:ABC transporter permease [Clostridiales bacterium]
MKALFYGIGLQFKLDIRSKGMLITCYLIPLVFFLFMGGIFTSIDADAAKTLISSMTVFTITMSALMGLPPALAEVYGTDVKKVYKANGAPIWFGVITQFISSFIHTLAVCLIIFAVSPFIFKAELPADILMYFLSLIALLAVTLAVGCIFGLLIKQQSKLTMAAMIIFLPSIMLSGIMFPAELLPTFMQYISYAFPATIAFKAMTSIQIWHLPVLVAVFAVLCGVIALLLKFRIKR